MKVFVFFTSPLWSSHQHLKNIHPDGGLRWGFLSGCKDLHRQLEVFQIFQKFSHWLASFPLLSSTLTADFSRSLFHTLSLSLSCLSLQWQLFIILFSILCFPSSFPPSHSKLTHTHPLPVGPHHEREGAHCPKWKRRTFNKIVKAGKTKFYEVLQQLQHQWTCEALTWASERERLSKHEYVI